LQPAYQGKPNRLSPIKLTKRSPKHANGNIKDMVPKIKHHLSKKRMSKNHLSTLEKVSNFMILNSPSRNTSSFDLEEGKKIPRSYQNSKKLLNQRS
jgi:hypothetical protein